MFRPFQSLKLMTTRLLLTPLRRMYPGGILVGCTLDAISISGQCDILAEDVKVVTNRGSQVVGNLFTTTRRDGRFPIEFSTEFVNCTDHAYPGTVSSRR